MAVATEVTNEYLGTKLSLCFEVAGRTDAGPAKTPKRSVYEDRDVRKILDTFEGSVMSVENEDQS